MAHPTSSDPAEEAIDRILLDIKALAFVSTSEAALVRGLRDRILASHDADTKRFVAALEPVRTTRPWGQVLIGIGELLLAAFLTVAGFVTIVPAVLGLGSPAQVTRYLGDLFSTVSAAGLSDPIILAMDFAFAVFLLLAALYTLRQTAGHLRNAGILGEAERGQTP